MPIKYNSLMTDFRLDELELTVGSSPQLRILTGSPPANTAAAQTGTLLIEIELPISWLAAASGGVKAKSGTWSGTAVASGTAGYFRITDFPGTTAHIQGTCGTSGADMILDGATITAGQVVTVVTFAITGPGA